MSSGIDVRSGLVQAPRFSEFGLLESLSIGSGWSLIWGVIFYFHRGEENQN